MNSVTKPYLHLSINAVDTVVFDPEGYHDNDRSDRFDTFDEARNAATFMHRAHARRGRLR